MPFSILLPIMVTAVGGFLLIKLKFFFIIHPLRSTKALLDSLKDRGNRRSLCLALAGTLGVGNIFGVCAGIMIGGAGCLFWIFLSSFFSMIIKYAETLLAFDNRGERTGTSGVIRSAFGRFGRILSSVYAALTVIIALSMGSAIQAEALTDVASVTLGLHPAVTALILSVLFIPCLIGGAQKIEKITEVLIPLTTIIYISMCLPVIFMNLSKIPAVICEVISSAFSGRAAIGGISVIAIKEGFARGILSNEAGVGTSALAHSRSENREPHIAGLFGICEVFFDTTLLCTLTGLVILLSGGEASSLSTPMSLISTAFSSCLGALSSYALVILIFAFAYSTVICWYFYGHECLSLLAPRLTPLYTLAFVLLFFFCGVISSEALLAFTDVIIFLMSVLTLSAIIKKSDRIKLLSDKL